jgi:hypothetical protein
VSWGLRLFWLQYCASLRSGQFGPQEKPLEIAVDVFCPHKKIISHTISISGALIVYNLLHSVFAILWDCRGRLVASSCALQWTCRVTLCPVNSLSSLPGGERTAVPRSLTLLLHAVLNSHEKMLSPGVKWILMFREQPERGEPHPHQPQQPSQARQERRSVYLSVVFEELL